MSDEELMAELRAAIEAYNALPARRVRLPEYPQKGTWMVIDPQGRLRVELREDDVLQREVEGIAAALSSKGETVVMFRLYGQNQVMSRWRKGRMIDDL